MELKEGQTRRRCHCGGMEFVVTVADAERIDAGEAGVRCGQACWGLYLIRNKNKEKGKQ